MNKRSLLGRMLCLCFMFAGMNSYAHVCDDECGNPTDAGDCKTLVDDGPFCSTLCPEPSPPMPASCVDDCGPRCS
ncbi:hypothetical protein [Spartinivicinus ruber]|uniref:hypothetical protein n=1 Tax=Spartinivicinus ruber TaxID=2683272 RepID=UPI0013CF6F29|nr:hypothetical protein [Spartinivicinus ruber]